MDMYTISEEPHEEILDDGHFSEHNENAGGDLPALTTKRARKIYREVWADFYTWEQTISAHYLAEFCNGSLLRVGRSNASIAVDDRELDIGHPRPTVGLQVTLDEMLVCLAGASGPVTTSTNIFNAQTIDCCQTYESCTPCTHSMGPRRGEFEGEILPFIPYADDPAFEHESFFERFEVFQWQNPSSCRGSDCKYSHVLVNK